MAKTPQDAGLRGRHIRAVLWSAVAITAWQVFVGSRTGGSGSDVEFASLALALVLPVALFQTTVVVLAVRALILLPGRAPTRPRVMGRGAGVQIVATALGIYLGTRSSWDVATSGRYVEQGMLAGASFIGGLVGTVVGSVGAALVGPTPVRGSDATPGGTPPGTPWPRLHPPAPPADGE